AADINETSLPIQAIGEQLAAQLDLITPGPTGPATRSRALTTTGCGAGSDGSWNEGALGIEDRRIAAVGIGEGPPLLLIEEAKDIAQRDLVGYVPRRLIYKRRIPGVVERDVI